ncbi:binding-protein-dependent transport systems inner membrane component [Paenibacillus vortex V453]|jgi:peptide/nickel transport system permease protein|uniref:Peptide ABC transporter permease n=2 Tax=Paenibacillus TaxID=44249 RepID=A0A163JGC4_9BACL|nr:MULTISPECIES: ABC transporter permease [Paenibacillus]ANA80546.1 peptide ABC transporter permease [Paenibacillus glucanolyticus]AVV55384.1 ABC transporter permease [Paenibacillus glucanolyticus]EFU43186.1 binding-protein-dependent transport systems inner membrane component [Paenibacillus vortex V453]ETT31008.1 binding-protein-dependent transport systems inner membrane component [Paenibacillus sp. FSL R5-808]KZS46569.1 peptide ABC transporter permease [Paenibacillus glucanolyticus]
MLIYSIRRLIQTIPVVIGVTIVVFLLMHLIPGDAAQVIIGEGAPKEQVEKIRENLGLNDPLPLQYWNYVSGLLQGDLGDSIRSNRPIADEIFKSRFWITVELAIYSTILAVFLGILAGIISAVKKSSPADIGVMFIALFGLSMPNFWLGLMLIQYFAVDLGWFRPSGWGTWSQTVLPVITLGTGGAAIIARMTRSSMLEVIGQDYIRTARAKGVRERIIVYRHALKNAMIPVITVIGLEFGGLLGGAVLTESVFAVNGMGRYVIDSIRARDFPVVQATVLVLSVMFVLVNLLVDISYRYFNKRIDFD